jgi:hypothetical protein
MAKRKQKRNAEHPAAARLRGEPVAMSDLVKVLHEETGSDDSAWILFETKEGYTMMEYWDYPEGYGDEGGDFIVYRWDVAEDVMSDLDWLDWDGVASYSGVDIEEIRKASTSKNPIARAQVYELMFGYESKENLDSYPLHLSQYEMHLRWPDIVDQPDINIDHEAYGPDEQEPENGLRVKVWNNEAEITEWTDIYAATGEAENEDAGVLRQDATVDLEELLNPKAKHRGVYGGDKGLSFEEVLQLRDAEDREKAIVAAAIGYMGYYGGEESNVDRVGG